MAMSTSWWTMPSGRTHAFVAVPIAVTLTGVAVGASLLVSPVCVGVGLGAWAGLLVTPDIDHHYVTHEEQRIARHMGCVVGWLWRMYWWPYESLNAHRGASHTWPRGTLERFVYLCWPLLIASLWLQVAEVWLFWLCVVAGWSVQDIAHIALDNAS